MKIGSYLTIILYTHKIGGLPFFPAVVPFVVVKASISKGRPADVLDEIVQAKIKRNNEKYPVDKAKGSKEKYDQLD